MSRGPIPDRPASRPTVPEVVALARAYYAEPGHAVGGNLHIVLDDGNLADHHVRWCGERAKAEDDMAGVTLAEKILALSGTQRRRVYRAMR